ncbi:MAG: TfoX/Sxy family protein [Anaerolineaceae bacterium]
MAYDEGLSFRVEEILADTSAFIAKKMFGGIGYLIRGNMTCGVIQNALIVRLSQQDYQTALQKPNTRKFEMTGKEMRGWLLVDPDGTSDDNDLKNWINSALQFSATLPPK